MSKKSRLRGPSDKQHGKRSQALFKFWSQHFDHIHRSLRRKLSWKKSVLLRCKILRVLVNTLAACEKYLVLYRDNLMIPVHIKLPEKKTLPEFFTAFLKSILTFEHFEWKDDRHSFCISEITDSEKVVR